MKRREFITLLGGAAAWPLAARAQQSAMPVIGFLHGGSANAFAHLPVALRRGLAETDLVEGRNVAVEYRWGEGQFDGLPALAADLVRRQVAVIVGPASAVQVAKSMTTTIPLVFVAADDPIKLGFVESLNRPGGSMTGVYMFTVDLEEKRLGLLRDVVPTATTFGVLVNPNYPAAEVQLRDVQNAAIRLGMKLLVVRANSDADFDAAFSTLVEQRAAALSASPFFNGNRGRLVALAAHHKIPTIYEWREFAAVGGLLSYGNSITDTYTKAGLYAGRIAKGAKPADLPVLQPTKFELVINLKTAKALNVRISDNLLTLADEVIE
jgi:putative ABC transport system substrate-binding protein